MSSTNPIFSQKEYLKKYLSGEDVKKKKKKKISSNALKRSKIIDDDIDVANMRPLDREEVDLYQLDDEAPQIAGIIDERPAEVKAQEYYNPKRWKVFGGDDGVNVVDSLDGKNSSTKVIQDVEDVKRDTSRSKIKSIDSKKSGQVKKSRSSDSDESLPRKSKGDISPESSSRRKVLKKHVSRDSDPSPPRKESRPKTSSKHQDGYDSDKSPPRKSKHNKRDESDSDVSPPRKDSRKRSPKRNDSDASPPRKNSRRKSPQRHDYKYDSDNSPPRNSKSAKRHGSDSDASPPRRDSRRKSPKRQNKHDSDNSPPRKSKSTKRNDNDSDASPPRRDSRRTSPKRPNKYNSDNSPPRKSKSTKRNDSDSDASPPRRDSRRKSPKRHNKYDSDNSPPRKSKSAKKNNSDSDTSPPRRDSRRTSPKRHTKYDSDNSPPRKSKSAKRNYSDSDASPPRKDSKRKSPKRYDSDPSPPRNNSRQSPSRYDKSIRNKEMPSRLSRKDLMDGKVFKSRFSDSDDSPPRKRRSSNSFTDRTPPRIKEGPKKKVLYKPNDSSSDERHSKKSKMKTTLDGKQAGLQDAKQLKKELSDLRMKEDLIFSKMEASVSGVGAAPVKRDRKTGQIRDLEKEKEAQKEKEAKDSVVKEKYHKWGKGLKQTADAEERMAEMMKEMNKPLARYRDDKDLDEFLKAQDREGDPMLDYVKRKQSEATPLTGVKPIYKGSYNPNRFGIRPGHRWDGVVRSNGYEKEWFTHQNARKARDDEAYKWSTSDM